MPAKTATASLTLERTYKQPPEAVWAAWTDPEQMVRWFLPGDLPAVRVPEFDARPGGRYRIEFAAPTGAGTHVAEGTFREVVPGKRLSFTWDWAGQPAMGSVVTVELAKAGTGTRLTLRHDGLPSGEAMAQHELGWNGILDRYTLLHDPLANKAVVRRFLEEGAGKGDAKAIEATVGERFVWHKPMPGVPPTREGVQMAIAGFRAAFPDYRLEVLDLLGDGDKVLSRIRFRGTNTGSLMGMPPTGKPVELEFWHLERLVDGRIVERWDVLDNLAMMKQLGLA